ncbi:MAG: hypothetical protein ABIO49_04825 [Dokdonella sp.]
MDAFSAEWITAERIAAWNSRNLERILSHTSEDVMLNSEMVRSVTGG